MVYHRESKKFLSGYETVKDWEYCLIAWHGKSRFQKISRLLIDERITRILDIGCGDGFFLKTILPKAIKIGIDIIRIKRPNDFYYVQSNIEFGLPFKNESFDALIAGEIIEHLLDTEFFLRECVRVLKKNGFIILTTPNLCSLKNVFLILQGKQAVGVDFSIKEGTGHIRAFSPRSMIFLLQKVGFRVEYLCSDRLPIPFAPPKSEFCLKIEQKLGDIFNRWGNNLVAKARRR